MKILFVEDMPLDAELAARLLRKDGMEFESMRVDTREAYLGALHEFLPDAIVSDYSMPSFDGMSALLLASMTLSSPSSCLPDQ
jgi:CheY-like chemotaxis protein